MTWTAQDDARIAALRARSAQGLTHAESEELRELRRREIIEATARRRAYFKRSNRLGKGW
jgi:hypothetical protein